MNKPWKKDSCSYFTDKYLLLFLPPLLPYFLPSNLLSSLPSIIFFLFLLPFFFPPLLPSSFLSLPLLFPLFFSSYSSFLPFLSSFLPTLHPFFLLSFPPAFLLFSFYVFLPPFHSCFLYAFLFSHFPVPSSPLLILPSILFFFSRLFFSSHSFLPPFLSTFLQYLPSFPPFLTKQRTKKPKIQRYYVAMYVLTDRRTSRTRCKVKSKWQKAYRHLWKLVYTFESGL